MTINTHLINAYSLECEAKRLINLLEEEGTNQEVISRAIDKELERAEALYDSTGIDNNLEVLYNKSDEAIARRRNIEDATEVAVELIEALDKVDDLYRTLEYLLDIIR